MAEARAREFVTVELFFDPEAEASIVGLQEEIAARLARTPPPVRPHLTLGGYWDPRGVPNASAFQAIEAAAAGETVSFGSLGIFPGERSVLFLAPVVTDALLALHRRADERLLDMVFPLFEVYRPGRWVPHCTLALDLGHPDLEAALRIAAAVPLPVTARIASIEVREYRAR